MDIHIDKNMLNKILNDDIEAELQGIVDKEFSKPPEDINWSKVVECKNTINLLKDGDKI